MDIEIRKEKSPEASLGAYFLKKGAFSAVTCYAAQI
jgi:hypothetical protein